MYKRELYKIVKRRIEEPRNFIQVLAGPRQVGKTTLMEQILKESQFPYTSEAADGVSSITSEWISDVWNSARSKMDFRGESEHLLVIDEIQKLSNWSETVKKEWDRDTREHRNLKVVILGSSRLMLMKGLTESLAGRFELIRMGHWDQNERINPKRWRRWVESAVGAYLINHAETVGYRMYYWREKSDEVDFVLVKNENTVAIEVKSGRRGNNNGLPLFREQFHPKRSFIVGTGGISVEEFLTTDLNRLF